MTPSPATPKQRFVVLLHQFPDDHHRENHWDLMLEDGEYLKTWLLEKLPNPNQTVNATPLPDHRLAYLEYEGPVSNNRGNVERVAQGHVSWNSSPVEQEIAKLHFSESAEIWLIRKNGAEAWSVTHLAAYR